MVSSLGGLDERRLRLGVVAVLGFRIARHTLHTLTGTVNRAHSLAERLVGVL